MKYTHEAPFSNGLNPLVADHENPELMGLNFSIAKIQASHNLVLDLHQESLIVLLSGSVTYEWGTQKESAQRSDPFYEPPSALHLNSETSCTIFANTLNAELIVVATENEKIFDSKLYRPGDLASVEVVGDDLLDGKTKRKKRVFFDRTSCPETNMFCGELVNFPGCWACFPHTSIPNQKYIITGFSLNQGTVSLSRETRYSRSDIMIWLEYLMEKPIHR